MRLVPCLLGLLSLVLSCTAGDSTIENHQSGVQVTNSIDNTIMVGPQTDSVTQEGVQLSGTSPTRSTIAETRERAAALRPEDKLDSDLKKVYQFVSLGRYREAKAFLKEANFTLNNDASEDHFSFDVELEALMGSDDRTQQLIENQRGTVLSRYHHLMVVRITPQLLMALARSDTTLVIKRPNPLVPAGEPAGSAVSEGVKSTLANLWHDKGFTGKGIKVAIIDVGFSGYKEQVTSGNLPANLTSKVFGPEKGGGAHGTQCAMIVYDMAPDASLYLVKTTFEADMLNAIDYLIAEKVDVISASVVSFNEGPYNGTSWISRKIDEAQANGILWANAAGNEAGLHWEGLFQNNGKGLHVWRNGDTQFQIKANTCPFAYLSWNDWDVGQNGFPGGNKSGQDYILRILKDGKVFKEVTSDNKNNKFSSPTVMASKTVDQSNAGIYEIQVERVGNTGNGDYLDFFIYGSVSDAEYPMSTGSIPNLADAERALTVGAYKNYSGEGPTNGKGGGAPDANSRIKPDLLAPTDVSTYGIGVLAFGGTSAATPHVAGAAALVKQAHPNYTAKDIQNYLEDLAIPSPNYPAGKNNGVGSGMLSLLDPKILGVAPIIMGVTPSTLNISSKIPLQVQVKGFNFSNKAKVEFVPPDLDIVLGTSIIVNSSFFVATVVPNSNAKPGLVDVVVINDLGASNETKGVGKGLIKLVTPNISSVSPSKQVPGWKGVIEIDGDLLADAASADLGLGIKAEKASASGDGTAVSAHVVIDPKASTGPRDVTLITKSGEKIVGKAMFEVVLPQSLKPEFLLVTPDKTVRGTETLLYILGQNLTENATIDLGDGVVVQQILGKYLGSGLFVGGKYVKGDLYNLQIQVKGDAAVGPRSVTISNKAGSVVAKNVFEVVIGPPPKITMVDPTTLSNGYSFAPISIEGKDFVKGAQVAFNPAVTTGLIEYIGNFDPMIQVTLTNLSKTKIGKRDVTITNPDGQSDTMVDAFEIVTEAPPTITDVPTVPVLTVPKDSVKKVNQKTVIESPVGLATVTMECGGGVPIVGIPPFDPSFSPHLYSFYFKIGPVTEAVVCQIVATDYVGQKSSASFGVMPAP